MASLLLAFATSCTHSPLNQRVEGYRLESTSLVDALLKIADRFRLPMGIEWIKSADALKPIHLSLERTTAAEVIQTLVSSCNGYDWNDDGGVVHVFKRNLLKDKRNPLSINISFSDQKLDVQMADAMLQSITMNAALTPENRMMSAVGYFSEGEPLYSFAARNVPARAILNRIIRAGVGGSPDVNTKRVWVATFPENQTFSRAGFLEVAPMLDPKVVPADKQPLWVCMAWGERIWERMER